MMKKLINIKNSILLAIIATFFLGCSTINDNTSSDYPPYAPQAIEICKNMRKITYQRLNQGRIELVTDKFPQKGSIHRRLIFEEILDNKFGMDLLPVFDPKLYPYCIMPIMDSAIVSKYGMNGKDSIIKLVNYLADSTFNAREPFVKHE